MLSPTLQEGLSAYAISPKIRAIRLKNKIGLVELGRHSGLSPATLSKIERGQLFPTLPTLLRIALVFSVGLDYFFAGNRERPVVGVVRHSDRRRHRTLKDDRPDRRRFAPRSSGASPLPHRSHANQPCRARPMREHAARRDRKGTAATGN
jgi:transcriptional regulator with XRE-family HTH domain